MAAEYTSTVEGFIKSSGINTIHYDNLSLLEKFGNNLMVSHNIINDYIDELDNIAVNVTLSDSEFNKYVYKPKLLAYDIYGSTELYFVILAMNNICNVKEFNFRKVKMLKAQDLEKFISAIYNSEKRTLEMNRDKIGV